jgi:RNA polymerase sigma-70 factor (ECF subfamily)
MKGSSMKSRRFCTNGGDSGAAARLMPIVYEELRRQARNYLFRERDSHTLQQTALVHEAYMRLVDQTRVDWKNRSHFYDMAATMMRRVLVDRARARASGRRGDGGMHLSMAVPRAER